MSLLLSALSGILLALAFPKFNLYWLAWVALIPLFVALSWSKNLKQALFCGFVFGLTFFGLHLFWMMTLFEFVKWWSVLGWLSLVIFQTLFILSLVVLVRIVGEPDERHMPLAIAVLWVVVEWMRAWGPFGVTGGDLGYSQTGFLSLIQIASFSSVYGVSFLIVFFNAAATQFLLAKRRWPTLLLSMVLILCSMGYGTYVLNNSQLPTPNSQFLKLALLQPNIPQKEKLNPAKVLPIFRIHEQMTRQAAAKKPDIIIWPETAIFSYLLRDPVLWPRLQKLAKEANAWLVLGTPHFEKGEAYNSVISMSPKGEVVSRYDKQHLVPFGEYLPFRKILFPLLKGVGYYDSAFSSNPKPELLKVKNKKIAAAICFESTFPQLIKRRSKKSSDFILLVTNDAWFADSSALYFHLNCGVFRAIENRKYFVQVGNTGISAVIDPYGRILEQTKTNQRKILSFEIPLS